MIPKNILYIRPPASWQVSCWNIVASMISRINWNVPKVHADAYDKSERTLKKCKGNAFQMNYTSMSYGLVLANNKMLLNLPHQRGMQWSFIAFYIFI